MPLDQVLFHGLQWGRGFDAAESRLDPSEPDHALGFNGAAALTPRKAQHASAHRMHRAASMGPRLLSRGETGAGMQQGNAMRGFNGAAASQPRRAC